MAEDQKVHQVLWAVWRYDHPPYYHMGRIVHLDDDGKCEIIEYGCGDRFKPIVILSDKAGRQVKEALEKLQTQFATKDAGLRKEIRRCANATVGVEKT